VCTHTHKVLQEDKQLFITPFSKEVYEKAFPPVNN